MMTQSSLEAHLREAIKNLKGNIDVLIRELNDISASIDRQDKYIPYLDDESIGNIISLIAEYRLLMAYNDKEE